MLSKLVMAGIKPVKFLKKHETKNGFRVAEAKQDLKLRCSASQIDLVYVRKILSEKWISIFGIASLSPSRRQSFSCWRSHDDT